MSSRADEILKPYDNVLTIRTSIGEVPVYKMIEKFLYIEDADGNKIKFILNDEQIDAYKEMCIQRLNDEPIRINFLKARQLGFSTFIAGVIFVKTIFEAGRKSGIIADTAEHASNLFSKYNFFYDNLPKEMQIEKVRSNAKELVVKYRNGQTSSIKIMVQGDNAGRSGTYQLLHLSECAFWADLKSTLTSLLQTVSATNKNSMVFLETTANGVNEYKNRWDNDWSGNSRYKALFYAWWGCPRYRVADKDIGSYSKPSWLYELQEKHNLDENQCRWYYDKFQEFDGDLDQLRQEFPSNPAEAFITSGNSVFNAELVRKRKEEIIREQKEKPCKKGIFTYNVAFSQDGKRIDLTNVEFMETRIGYLKIYKEPIPSHPYVVNNDNANGGEDYFATQVVDNYTGEQVAVYHRNKVDADEPAYQMVCLARYYNNAMISGETNTTSYLLEVCSKCGYDFIYQDQDVEDLGTRFANKFGYKTKQNNRTYMIDLFKISFRENPKIINDYDTICEMENFQILRNSKGTEKAQAITGEHDDLVMAMCGFYLCRGMQTSVPKNDPHLVHPKTYEELDWLVEEKNRNKTNQVRSVNTIWD